MWRGLSVAVVIPAFNEARLLPRMLRRLPACVDAAFVVDDHSSDGTSRAAEAVGDPRVRVVRHADNRGVGAAIASGYSAALEASHDVLVVMAGDDQMDPEDLPSLLDAVSLGGADYAKGNRFLHPEARRMPWPRRYGSALLSALTRLATGLDVGDTQCGYTALTRAAALRLPLGELWPRYGYPNDLLGMLAAGRCRVLDVPVRPVYADETSGLRPWHLAVIAMVIGRRWAKTREARSTRRTRTTEETGATGATRGARPVVATHPVQPVAEKPAGGT